MAITPYPLIIQSPITICSSALIMLGGTPISSFDDGSAGSDIAKAFYDVTLNTMLTERPWRFAAAEVDLVAITLLPITIPPAPPTVVSPDYKYAFQIPPDCLYILKVNNGNTNFNIYEDQIWTNDTKIRIQYTQRVLEENMPKYFIRALEYNLASLFAIPLMDKDDRAALYGKLYDRQIIKARHSDATQVPTETFGNSAYVGSRITT